MDVPGDGFSRDVLVTVHGTGCGDSGTLKKYGSGVPFPVYLCEAGDGIEQDSG